VKVKYVNSIKRVYDLDKERMNKSWHRVDAIGIFQGYSLIMGNLLKSKKHEITILTHNLNSDMTLNSSKIDFKKF